MSYSIVFSGQIRSGVDAEDARRNVGRLFRLEEGPQLARLFSGQPVVIKKGLSEDDARRYADTLLKAGVHCELKPASGSAPETAQAAALMAKPKAVTADVATRQSSVSQAPAPTPAPAKNADPFAGLSLVPVEPRPEAEPEPVPTAPMRSSSATSSPAGNASPYAVSRAARQSSGLEANSSGINGATLPADASGLCWGGFFMNWIWGIGNSTYIALLCVVPVIGWIVPFYLLFKGRELAWRNKHWDSVEHFNKIQRRWTIAGMIIVGLTVIGTISLGRSVSKDMEKQIAAQAAMSSEERQKQREEMLDKIEDPAMRAQMEEMYRAMDQAQAEQAASH